MNARAMAYDLRAYADWCIAHYEDVPPTIVNDLNATAAMIEQMEAELLAMRTAARSLKMALDKQNQRSRWIPVTERLPEKGMKLLLYVPKTEKVRQHGIFTGELKEVNADNGGGNFFGIPTPGSEWTLWGWCYYEKPNVTHWMPLPEAPEDA